MKNINEMINVFRVECRCVYQAGTKDDVVYEDNVIIINNFETAKTKYNYMVSKSNALGYYAHYDYYVKIRKCEVMDNGEPNCGDVIIQHMKGDKKYDERRIVLKTKSNLGWYAIYDNEEEKFLEYLKPFFAFETEWEGWKTITNNIKIQKLNKISNL